MTARASERKQCGRSDLNSALDRVYVQECCEQRPSQSIRAALRECFEPRLRLPDIPAHPLTFSAWERHNPSELSVYFEAKSATLTVSRRWLRCFSRSWPEFPRVIGLLILHHPPLDHRRLSPLKRWRSPRPRYESRITRVHCTSSFRHPGRVIHTTLGRSTPGEMEWKTWVHRSNLKIGMFSDRRRLKMLGVASVRKPSENSVQQCVT